MTRSSRQLAVPFAAAVLAASAFGLGQAARGDKPMEFDSYQLVLLRRPADAPQLPEAELEKLQGQHLGHLRKMAEAGKLVVAGPFQDQPDATMRGLCLYRVGSVAEAKALAEDDPSVKAGRLKVEAMTWLTEKGALKFPVAEALREKK